jgi:hypothetical protein
MSMEELQVGAATPLAVTGEVVPDVPAIVNIPLSGDQKFLLRSIQTRLANFAKSKLELDVQVARFEGILQLEMMKIAHSNKINMETSSLNDTLDIVPKPKEPASNPFGR